MVLEAIKTVGADVKIWLGVWVDGNATTNARSFRHMYEILDKWPVDMFEGVVVGNEVLFRQELTESQLSNVLTEVKSNLTGLGIDLPLATSDLGSKWTKDLVTAVDVLMANVHPFFGGVLATDAASWTERYFEEQNKPLAGSKRAMISEVGWPTEGGRRQGSVAGIDELNTFMKDFVCNQNAKGTEYYWFSAFDEPWKIKFNTAEEKWEDKWGLLDAERKVKDGLKIPECK
ncbi:glucan 1,3 beta-glucosidase-like protein [Kalaharituber pfeilii]|nr:glucan 1,3 beta-glucosidase-like protein [Kalaharituber pfeilii]